MIYQCLTLDKYLRGECTFCSISIRTLISHTYFWMLKWILVTFDEKHKAKLFAYCSVWVSVLFLTIHGNWQLMPICRRRVWIPQSKAISVKKASPGNASCPKKLCEMSLCVHLQSVTFHLSQVRDLKEQHSYVDIHIFFTTHMLIYIFFLSTCEETAMRTGFCSSDFRVCDPVSDLCPPLLRGKSDNSMTLQLFTYRPFIWKFTLL